MTSDWRPRTKILKTIRKWYVYVRLYGRDVIRIVFTVENQTYDVTFVYAHVYAHVYVPFSNGLRWQNRETANIGLVSSVGRATARQSGGRRFKSRSSKCFFVHPKLNIRFWYLIWFGSIVWLQTIYRIMVCSKCQHCQDFSHLLFLSFLYIPSCRYQRFQRFTCTILVGPLHSVTVHFSCTHLCQSDHKITFQTEL